MGENNSIDVTDLISMPLPCLEELIFELDPNAPGTDFVLSVIRWSAVVLICGMTMPNGANMQTAVHRGVETLAILRAYEGRRR